MIDMNTGWAFFRGDVENGAAADADVTAWMPVSLPHLMQWKPSIVVETPFTMGWAGIAATSRCPRRQETSVWWWSLKV